MSTNVEQIKENDIKFDKSALISLINSGCFDNLPMNDDEDEKSNRDFLLGKIFYKLGEM